MIQNLLKQGEFALNCGIFCFFVSSRGNVFVQVIGQNFTRSGEERDYEELKQELGLGHYEGRGWRGFHHHGTLCIAAYGFLVAERSRFSPSARTGQLDRTQKIPPDFQPVARRIRAERHNPNSIATLRIKLARFLLKQLPCCPFVAPSVYDTAALVRYSPYQCSMQGLRETY
jgi:hypothetical protein